MTGPGGFLRHPLLATCGVEHGFGLRGTPEPPHLVRPEQVHGAAVARVGPGGATGLEAADAIVADAPGVAVGVVTADCVPILLATPSGACVAAIHAGWRGLARGVIPAAIHALRRTTAEADRVRAVVGPCIGPCCYEVDAPVVEALTPHLGDALARVLRAGRPGHWQLDLGAAARLELERAGLSGAHAEQLEAACTACDAERFHSYRRDGAAAGRLVHFVAVRGADGSGAKEA